MNERAKITASHHSRQAIVYLRQSSPAQVEHNRESTERQYALANKARELGWPDEHIVVIDEDLGLSGSGSVARSGFARLTAEVALARVGLVLGLEVSRLARNNADWHRLIDLAGLTDTLIGDADGIYHPALFNDRLLLGLKGTMSEAELHVLRARLNGGIRNKAARGELRRGLPVGFVWGEADGEVLFHPDEAVNDLAGHRAGIVIQLDNKEIGTDLRGLAGAFLVRPPPRRRPAQQAEPGDAERQRHGKLSPRPEEGRAG